MGARPRDWQPLADSDPVPGDPDRIEELGRKLRRTADELERQLRHLKAAAEVTSWDSDAGAEFRGKAKKCRGRLEAAHRRYRTAADAIGDRVVDHGVDYESNATAPAGTYVTDLHRAQRIADIARHEARDADARGGAARRGLSGVVGERRKAELEKQEEEAGDALAAARAKLHEARRIRDAAARRAREALEDAVSDDPLKDGFRDRFADFVEQVAGVTELIAKWAGIAALTVGWIPLIGQGLSGLLGAISMVATLVNLACTATQVAMGDAAWTELAWSATGLLAMGAGKAFSKVAGRYVVGTLRRMRLAKGGKLSPREAKRSRQKFNRDSGKPARLEKGDVPQSIREPITELFKSSTWKGGFQGGYRQAWRELKDRGDGNVVKGVARSVSLADASVASDLKEVKHLSKSLDSSYAVNQVSRTATGLTVAGSGVTAGGLFIDEVH
ncbi:hypothetical protein [Streptomyces spectabilis]|uniref:ElaB/YqjD/DUF883 family membrane-anchored ribosome-binding protein n=1 Tax=Streptomyces spectabilis TaxID=68270 RepID=A0A5P2XBU5_STRST|nr:hypothetical protein [Streptomyces spectabilis]MBB5103441.1 ElaB/YqjD/DUF883 family membrane-anchored ribosome-binding protein [Streptomyces spectabilis]MCI3902631.1 hypothetical protein [Streptomyces spectabilis]QEV59952.1 hypothetical protein CP982_15385 [Streptomyces spectabilis]GGV49165.1 hypothetical protein GCM10010245_77430 [Streptomyces spectabilis]